jgi:cell division protein FtsN
MSGSAWGIVWLAIALKIPIVALLYIVWWAIKDPPVPEPQDDGGGSHDRDPRPHPRGRPPHPPRRGPHGAPEPSAPARVRVAQRPRRVPSGHRG